MKKRILVVDDDPTFARALCDHLVDDGFDVHHVTRGCSALSRVKAEMPDLVVLDVMLPDINGFDLCRVLRQGCHTGVIILTECARKADKLRGFNLGADDYITKPFDLDEFLARVRAVLRRTRPMIDRLELGSVFIDFRAQHAAKGTQLVRLTHREFELLEYLAERQERVVHRNELLREVWGYPDVPATRSVDHAIARLRKKIESDPHHPRFIHTVHGDGYCLTPEDSSGTSTISPE